jgi:monoamine oxidase
MVEHPVAVVGGGLAGLVAAYRLQQRGVSVTVFEAAERVGGRVSTERSAFGGKIVECGGEAIDTNHTALLSLIEEVGLEIDDVRAAEESGGEPCFYVHGRQLTATEVEYGLASIVTAARADRDGAEASVEAARALDAKSVREWIETRVPGGSNSRIGALLDVSYTIEFGAETTEQSAFNIVEMLSSSVEGKPSLFGSSDERFRVRGGNDQLVARLAGSLTGLIEFEHRLVAVRNNGGRAELLFEISGRDRIVRPHRAILAIPFRVLREIDLRTVELSDLKRRAILELGMGANSKLFLQFDTRYWRTFGCNGFTLSDTGYQCTWDATTAQQGGGGILVNYTGGNAAVRAGQRGLEAEARAFLNRIEPVFPGISAQWNRHAVLANWERYPHVRGSYAYYRVGQYTTFAGGEGTAEGALHFAGEQTCADFQGYMEGAVRSGERAAAEVADALT